MDMKKSLLVSGVTLAVSMLAFQNPAQARSAELKDPEAMEFDCKLNMKQAEKAVRSGLRARQWTHKTKKPGHLEGRIVVRGKHTLRVDIHYTGTSFDVNYKDSDNLNYKVKDDGTRRLHPNGNSWMDNLANDIKHNAYLMCP